MSNQLTHVRPDGVSNLSDCIRALGIFIRVQYGQAVVILYKLDSHRIDWCYILYLFSVWSNTRHRFIIWGSG